jgi:hypothetical protein
MDEVGAFDLSAEMVEEIDTNADRIIDQGEHLQWLHDELKLERSAAGPEHSEL